MHDPPAKPLAPVPPMDLAADAEGRPGAFVPAAAERRTMPRRIELTRADLVRDVTLLLAATNRGLKPTPQLLSHDETTAASILTLFVRALEAEMAA